MRAHAALAQLAREPEASPAHFAGCNSLHWFAFHVDTHCCCYAQMQGSKRKTTDGIPVPHVSNRSPRTEHLCICSTCSQPTLAPATHTIKQQRPSLHTPQGSNPVPLWIPQTPCCAPSQEFIDRRDLRQRPLPVSHQIGLRARSAVQQMLHRSPWAPSDMPSAIQSSAATAHMPDDVPSVISWRDI